MHELVLTIRFNLQTRQIGVAGPIDDKLLCYGMLDCARDAIRERVAQTTNGPKVEVPIFMGNGLSSVHTRD